jgi:glycosyltransferase involved in cell wall biosynthesis
VRILHTVTYYHPHWTGLTKYAQRLAEGHAARGHEVTVLTSRHRADLPRVEVVNGVRVCRLATLGRLSRGVVMPSFPSSASALIASHDIVIAHIPMLETWLITWLAKRHDRPSVVIDHGDLVMPAGVFNQLVQGSVRTVMTRGLDLATVVMTHSQDYAQHSEFLWPFHDKLHCIYPPVEIPPPDLQGMEALRKRLGLVDASVVGFAGRFVEEKGFDFLLQAVPLVAEQIPNVRFAFAGERFVAYERFYQQWAHLFEEQRGRVVPVGLIEDPQELANFYGMCDAFAIPSRTDCFPSVQVEVMMCGTPVVTADIPGARVAVQVTDAGLLVEPRDPGALADGIVQVLRNPGAYTKPRAEVEAVLGIEQSLAAYEALFRSLIDAGAPVQR